MKVFTLIFLTILLSCGKSGSEQKKTATIEPEDIVSLLEGQRFFCESMDGGPCPEGMARLFMINEVDPNQSGLCSGFLTSETRLITNAHCVPTQEQCDQTYIAIFVNGRTEVAQCGKLVKLYEDFVPLQNKAKDVAIIDLDRKVLGGEVFKYSLRIPKKNEVMRVWAVDHLTLLDARITELECVMDERSSSLILRRCPSISGNSGSPVVNSRGEVLGVLWGATTDDSINEFYPLSERRKINARTYATEVSYFKDDF